MQRIAENKLPQELNNGVMRVYLLAGNDRFLLDSCFSRIKKAVLGTDSEALFTFSQKELCDGGFEELFYSLSLLGERRLALVEDFQPSTLSAAAREILESLLPTTPDDLTVVFRYQSDERRFSIPKKAQDIAELCVDAAIVTALAKEGAELERYIEAIAKREGCAISKAAVQELVFLCGDDLLMLQSELQKLAALANYDGITEAHVAALGVRTAEAGVYKMLSAIENGKPSVAVNILRNMLDDMEEPLGIAAVLNTAFVNLYRARLTRDAGHALAYLADHFNYAKGERKISIAFDNCRKYSLRKLEQALGILFRMDAKLKSSGGEQRIILEQNVIALALAVQQ